MSEPIAPYRSRKLNTREPLSQTIAGANLEELIAFYYATHIATRLPLDVRIPENPSLMINDVCLKIQSLFEDPKSHLLPPPNLFQVIDILFGYLNTHYVVVGNALQKRP